MTVSAIMTLVSTLGFPIVMCGTLLWYIKYITDQHRTEMSIQRSEHVKEVEKMTDAVNNNTLVIQKLVTIIEERFK